MWISILLKVLCNPKYQCHFEDKKQIFSHHNQKLVLENLEYISCEQDIHSTSHTHCCVNKENIRKYNESFLKRFH